MPFLMGFLIPPFFTIRLLAPEPSVLNTNSPIPICEISLEAEMRVAAAASPKMERFDLSRACICLE